LPPARRVAFEAARPAAAFLAPFAGVLARFCFAFLAAAFFVALSAIVVTSRSRTYRSF
jgi:hypothetical protein